jgi:hypothetical protein
MRSLTGFRVPLRRNGLPPIARVMQRAAHQAWPRFCMPLCERPRFGLVRLQVVLHEMLGRFRDCRSGSPRPKARSGGPWRSRTACHKAVSTECKTLSTPPNMPLRNCQPVSSRLGETTALSLAGIDDTSAARIGGGRNAAAAVTEAVNLNCRLDDSIKQAPFSQGGWFAPAALGAIPRRSRL